MGIIMGMNLLIEASPLPHKILELISFIDSFNGRWEVASWLRPDVLSQLKRTTIITSSGSSTRIEGARLTNEQIRQALKGLKIQNLVSRDEKEVQGYIELLEMVFDRYSAISLTESNIKTLHKHLMDYVDEADRHKGCYKSLPNHVMAYDNMTKEEVGVVMETTEPAFTEIEMKKLIQAYQQAKARRIHSLLALAEFVLRFLKIHPFQDGNGRLSRILTNLIFLQSGYSFVQYVSHEKFIEDNKEDYYLALNKGQKALLKNELPVDWFVFFLNILKQQIVFIRERVDIEKQLTKLKQREKEILNIALQQERITNQIIRKRLGYSPNTIKKDLKNLVDNGKLDKHGVGKGTYYTVK